MMMNRLKQFWLVAKIVMVIILSEVIMRVMIFEEYIKDEIKLTS